MTDIEPIYRHVGHQLRQARLDTGRSAALTAELAGRKGNTLTTYELGKRRMGLHQFVALCQAVNLDPAEVLRAALEAEEKQR